jgi:DNA-binding XRE family transcriptional regulator
MSNETAEFVKGARARLDLTQAEFAERVGLERRSIVRYEQGGELSLTVKLAIKYLMLRLDLQEQKREQKKKEGRRARNGRIVKKGTAQVHR